MQKRDFFRNVQKKRYASRTFKNPYFASSQKTSRRPIFGVLAIIFVVVLSIFLLLKFTNRPLSEVSVSGLQSISPDDFSAAIHDYLDQPAFLVFSRSQKLFFQEDELRTHLESRYAFDQLDLWVEKSTLFVSATEKQPQVIWSTGGELFLVSLQGSIIRSLSESERQALATPPGEGEQAHPLVSLPLFIDVNDTDVETNSPVLSEEELQNILRFHDHLNRQGIGRLETRIDRLAGKWIAVRTSAGYDILFDATGDIDAQALNLETLWQTTIKPDQELEYIDLRFGDHVYYR